MALLVLSCSSQGQGPDPVQQVPGVQRLTPSPRPETVESPLAPDEDAPPGTVTEVGFTVRDMESTLLFFDKTLGAAKVGVRTVSGPEFEALTGISGAKAEVVQLRLGNARIALSHYEKVQGAFPEVPASNDLTFQHMALVVRDMDEAYRRLNPMVVTAVTPVSLQGPETIPESNPAAAGIRAYYFRGPEGHPLELIWYPAGKGREAWHRPRGPLLLGVDHTAIAVTDRARSQAFYETLGMRKLGTSFNTGIEQERLSGVDGARVRIVGMGGPKDSPGGVGVEFLEYEEPGPGRPRPRDLPPNDVRHWETSIAVQDVDAMLERLRATEVSVVSTRSAECGACAVGSRAALVRDPDGHVVRLVEVR